MAALSRKLPIDKFFRIYPLALLWMAVPLAASIFFNASHKWGAPADVLRECWSILTWRYNYEMIYGPIKTNLALYWSLVIEEHFYFVFPFVFVFIRCRRNLTIFLGALAIVDAALVRPFYMPRGMNGNSYEFSFELLTYLTHNCIDQLRVGCIMGLYEKELWNFKLSRITLFCGAVNQRRLGRRHRSRSRRCGARDPCAIDRKSIERLCSFNENHSS